MSREKEPETTVLTLGYGTRTLEEFTELLQIYGVTTLIDVRAMPRSRFSPEFNKEALPSHLKHYGIKYISIPEIGGMRRPKPNSTNLALEGQFRGYADYMQTKEFTEQLLKIMALARDGRVALMCAEALPYKCHRILISDALVVRHIKVGHIISKDSTINHELNEMAQVEGTKITYPLYSKETPQRTLSDYGAT